MAKKTETVSLERIDALLEEIIRAEKDLLRSKKELAQECCGLYEELRNGKTTGDKFLDYAFMDARALMLGDTAEHKRDMDYKGSYENLRSLNRNLNQKKGR